MRFAAYNLSNGWHRAGNSQSGHFCRAAEDDISSDPHRNVQTKGHWSMQIIPVPNMEHLQGSMRFCAGITLGCHSLHPSRFFWAFRKTKRSSWHGGRWFVQNVDWCCWKLTWGSYNQNHINYPVLSYFLVSEAPCFITADFLRVLLGRGLARDQPMALRWFWWKRHKHNMSSFRFINWLNSSFGGKKEP